MTQEDKELLFKDLCARLPYGVKCENFSHTYGRNVFKVTDIRDNGYICGIIDDQYGSSVFDPLELKPYLFPLSSMTDKQAKEIQEIIGNPNYACIMRKTGGLELWLESIDTDPTIWLDTIFEVQDYLNKNKFDYRGLIEKGLAIDATGLNIY